MHTTSVSHFKSPRYNIFQNYKLVKKKFLNAKNGSQSDVSLQTVALNFTVQI